MRSAGKNNRTASSDGKAKDSFSFCKKLIGSVLHLLSVRRMLSARRKTLKRFAFLRFVAVATK